MWQENSLHTTCLFLEVDAMQALLRQAAVRLGQGQKISVTILRCCTMMAQCCKFLQGLELHIAHLR